MGDGWRIAGMAQGTYHRSRRHRNAGCFDSFCSWIGRRRLDHEGGTRMGSRITWCGIGLVSMFAFASLTDAAIEPQGQPSRARPVTLEGFVLGPDGSPAEGAVVVSSAGGRAVTDVAGSYRLEVELPPEATSVQVTAVGRTGANLVASARVALGAASSTNRVDPLALSLGSGCQPGWIPTFGEQPGTDDDVSALAVYDDGGGPALYIGGNFVSAGGTATNRIAKWDGTSWTALGSGASGFVRALAVYDDGSGPALHAGDNLGLVRKWDGSTWSALGSASFGGGSVLALTVYDDGGGPALYAGGGFTSIGGVPASKIAKWDGSSWTPLGSGVTGGGSVQAPVVDGDGGGPALYAGGGFTSMGGLPANRIAKWNGVSWTTLGSGMNQPVVDLVTFDDGSGTALYAGGSFTSADGVAANRIARWDGSTWTALGSGVSGGVFPGVSVMIVHDDGSGTALYAGGSFTSAGGVAANGAAKWDGSTWTALGSGVNGGSFPGVSAMIVHDDGSGPAIYAGGNFTLAGGVEASRIARWDGSSWSALGSRPGLNDRVWALAVHDDGGGPAVYVGVKVIEEWDGASWSSVGRGVNHNVDAFATYDDGAGPALYAGGAFTIAGGGAASHIAKWDGSSWSALGTGTDNVVFALAAYDDGAGPALYAGGAFTIAGGVAASHIAKWDGSSWSALVTGIDSTVHALAAYDDGAGPALYAGGEFTRAGGVAAGGIAKWDGSSWSALG